MRILVLSIPLSPVQLAGASLVAAFAGSVLQFIEIQNYDNFILNLQNEVGA